MTKEQVPTLNVMFRKEGNIWLPYHVADSHFVNRPICGRAHGKAIPRPCATYSKNLDGKAGEFFVLRKYHPCACSGIFWLGQKR